MKQEQIKEQPIIKPIEKPIKRPLDKFKIERLPGKPIRVDKRPEVLKKHIKKDGRR
jgi:hypothetical protein